MFMLEFILIVLLVITLMLLVAVVVAGVYCYWMMLVLPLLLAVQCASQWVYHRYFVPPASHYEELRRELRNRNRIS